MLGLALFLVCLFHNAGAAVTVTNLFNTGGAKQLATFTATLKPTPALPLGKITFTDQVGTGPKTPIGQPVQVTVVNGVAQATITKTYPTGPTFAVGSVDHKIVGQYSGTPVQTSPAFIHKVFNGQTSTTVTTNKAAYVLGETVTITATVKKVSGQGAFALPAGNTAIIFSHNNIPFTCKVITKIATGWTCTYLIPNTEFAGSHQFGAIFKGIPTTKYGGSKGAKPVTISCSSNLANCIGDQKCETNIATNVSNCGACRKVCDLPNTNAHLCVAKVCTISTCDTGFGDCNKTAPGCETPLNTLTNCGGCGTACNLPQATSSCGSGQCQVQTCNAGFGDCNPLPGCETATNTSENCGGCGTKCQFRQFPHAVATCATGTCSIDSCDEGWKDCTAAPGCETNPNTDLNNCGNCSVVCPDTFGTPTCINGVCGFTCPTGFKNCEVSNADCESNVNTDTNNCGNCDVKCNLPNTDAHICNNGVCQVSTCDNTFGDCIFTAPGCETSLLTLDNCGNCGTPCALPNAVATCASGTCEVATCNTGFKSCTAAPGCETDTNNDVNNCGNCGTVCASANGTATCTSGVCSITCDAGFKNCDGDFSNGCEASCSTANPVLTYNIALSQYPTTQTCPDAVTALAAGGIPRFATGVFNSNWVRATRDGIELGLRAEERRLPPIIPTFNNIYETIACPSEGKDSELDNGGEARWNYGISINLLSATGAVAGTTLADWDVKLTVTPVAEVLTGFPLEIDVKDYLGTNLLQEICSKCSAEFAPFPFTIGNEIFPAEDDCTDFYSQANKARAVGALKILQESSNLNFKFPNFPFLDPHQYKVQLTLTHKTLECVCPLQVEIIVSVAPPPNNKCPLLTCDVAGQIECNADGKDGCETNSRTLTDCNGCGISCNPSNTADGTCSTGVCTFATCNTNYKSCDGINSNGCEYKQDTQSTIVSDIDIPKFVISNNCTYASSQLTLGQIPRVGSGNVDGEWVTTQVDGIIIGLRAEERGQGTYPVTFDGQYYTYTSYACQSYSTKVTDVIKAARWNYGFSVDLSGFTGGGSPTLADFDALLHIHAQNGIATGVGEETVSDLEFDVKAFGPGLLGDIVQKLKKPDNSACLTFPVTVNGQSFADATALVAPTGGATDELTLIQESTNIAFDNQFKYSSTYNTINVYDVTLTLTSKIDCAPKSISVAIRVNVVADPGAGNCPGGDTCCNVCPTGCGAN